MLRTQFRRIKPFIVGMATYVPGVYNLFTKTGGTVLSTYCYSVWMRHLVTAYQHNLLKSAPATVAEFGPGDSLGIGLAALLSGAERYYAVDMVEYANVQRNLRIFDDLVSMFQNRMDIPDNNIFPKVGPLLDSYRFPSHILTNEHLARCLADSRLQSIRQAISNAHYRAGDNYSITYTVPWNNVHVVDESSIDMIYSQAVLEHVDNLELAYQAMHRWLKPGGFMSHDIDFTSHGMGKKWNSHWRYSDLEWKIIRGKRSYLINRHPYSYHMKILRQLGFKVTEVMKKTAPGIRREELTPRFQHLSDDDLSTLHVTILATKQA